MLRAILNLVSALPLILAPALVAQGRTGIAEFGLAGLLFSLAAALILTLLLRRATSRIAHLLVVSIGKARIRRVITKSSERFLEEVMLPGAYGGLAKIDFAVLTPTGILCIRAVNFGGLVFGQEDEAQWTNVFAGKRRRFLNPLIQNEGRRRALTQALPETPVKSLVVFTGSVEFASELPRNVIQLARLETFLKKFSFGPSEIKDWDTTWLELQDVAISDEDSKKDYEAQIGFC